MRARERFAFALFATLAALAEDPASRAELDKTSVECLIVARENRDCQFTRSRRCKGDTAGGSLSPRPANTVPQRPVINWNKRFRYGHYFGCLPLHGRSDAIANRFRDRHHALLNTGQATIVSQSCIPYTRG